MRRVKVSSLVLALSLLCVTIAGVIPAANAGQAAPDLSVTVSIAPDLSSIKGQCVFRLKNVSAHSLSSIPIWTFPGRLSQEPRDMPEVEAPAMFPRGFDPAHMTLTGVSDISGKVLAHRSVSTTLSEVELLEPLKPGQELTLRVAFETKVPRRFGPFGRVNGQLLVDGGAFPRLPPLDTKGFHIASPPGSVRWALDVAWSGPREALLAVNGEVARVGAEQARASFTGESERVSLSLLEGGVWSRFEHAGVVYRLLHRGGRCHAARPGAFVDFGCIDVQGQVLASMAYSLEWLRGNVGPTISRAFPREVTIVQVPLRRDVALRAPGMVLVSDRAFEVIPVERAHKFHRIALSRALFAQLLEAPLELPPWPMRAQALDMVAVALAQRWEIFQYGQHESGMDVLDDGSFMAAIDDTMAAPQVPFLSTYFAMTDDSDRYRDRFTLFSHRRPTGRLWLAKLRDRYGGSAVERLLNAVVRSGAPVDKSLEKLGADTHRYLEQWDEGAPALNYRLGDVVPGRDERGPYVDVEILREGGEPGFIEHVSVSLDGSGEFAEAHVEVDGPAKVVRLRTETLLKSPRVEIDPRGRLVERSEEALRDARRDNRNFSRWRYRLDGIFATINSASGHLDLSLITSLKALQEPQHLLTLVASNVERSLGVGGSYLHGFGPLILSNLHRYHVGAGLSLSWLKATEVEPDGMALKLSASLSETTFESATDPRNGYRWGVSGGPSMLYQGGEWIFAASIRGAATGLVEVSPSHVLAGHFSVTSLFGDLPTTQSLGIGGVGGVRAFGTFARTGRHRVLARAEWRHRFTGDFSWNVMRLLWVRSIDGVAFVDAALLADTPEDFGLASSVFVGAGYGFRFHYLVGGVYPMVFLIDVGIPVVDGGHLGVRSGPGFSTVVGVDQAF